MPAATAFAASKCARSSRVASDSTLSSWASTATHSKTNFDCGAPVDAHAQKAMAVVRTGSADYFRLTPVGVPPRARAQQAGAVVVVIAIIVAIRGVLLLRI